MRIHFATPGIGRARHIDVEHGPKGFADILMVGLPRFADLFDLDRIVLDLRNKTGVVPPDALVIRAHPRSASRLTPEHGRTANDLSILEQRVRIPIYLLYFAEGEHRLSQVAGPPAPSGVLDESHLDAMRQAEFNFYATDPGALLPSSGTFHYVGPNGNHYTSFLRVGSAIQSPEELDAAAFWLLPHASAKTFVVVETATIAVIGLHLGQYLNEEYPGTTGPRVTSVQAVGGYTDSAIRDFIVRARAVRIQHSDDTSALIIYSVVSSGYLSTKLHAATRDLAFTDVQSVALFGTPDHGLDAHSAPEMFCTLRDNLGRSTEADCSRCDPRSLNRSPALQISPSTFTVGVAESVVPTKLDMSFSAPSVEMVGRYLDTEAFSVHRTDPSNDRHHAVHVDIGLLAETDTFKSLFIAKIRELHGLVDVILHPAHEPALKMAALARDVLGVTAICADPDDLRTATPEQRAALALPRLLIIDDAIVSGDRLRSYRSSLIHAGLTHDECHVLVGLLRVENEDERRGIANIVHQMGARETYLHSVEEIFLPNWQESECPWCWESALLADQTEPTQTIIDRYELIDSVSGMQTDLFWKWNNGTFPLGPGSVFGPESLTEAQLFTIIASALQNMRSQHLLDEEFTPPVSKVLSHEFWATGRYYVDVVVASILRAARPHDLTAPTPGKKYVKAAEKRLNGEGGPSLRSEIFLAMAAKKMPVTPGALQILTESDTDDGLSALFARLLELD